VTAPVSLAEIKGRHVYGGATVYVWEHERDALVELAEAYLAVRDFDERPSGMGFVGEEAAQARLALAAKGVRP